VFVNSDARERLAQLARLNPARRLFGSIVALRLSDDSEGKQ